MLMECKLWEDLKYGRWLWQTFITEPENQRAMGKEGFASLRTCITWELQERTDASGTPSASVQQTMTSGANQSALRRTCVNESTIHLGFVQWLQTGKLLSFLWVLLLSLRRFLGLKNYCLLTLPEGIKKKPDIQMVLIREKKMGNRLHP